MIKKTKQWHSWIEKHSSSAALWNLWRNKWPFSFWQLYCFWHRISSAFLGAPHDWVTSIRWLLPLRLRLLRLQRTKFMTPDTERYLGYLSPTTKNLPKWITFHKAWSLRPELHIFSIWASLIILYQSVRLYLPANYCISSLLDAAQPT